MHTRAEPQLTQTTPWWIPAGRLLPWLRITKQERIRVSRGFHGIGEWPLTYTATPKPQNNWSQQKQVREAQIKKIKNTMLATTPSSSGVKLQPWGSCRRRAASPALLPPTATGRIIVDSGRTLPSPLPLRAVASESAQTSRAPQPQVHRTHACIVAQKCFLRHELIFLYRWRLPAAASAIGCQRGEDAGQLRPGVRHAPRKAVRTGGGNSCGFASFGGIAPHTIDRHCNS